MAKLKLWPKQGAALPASAPKVPAADKAKPASPTTAEPKLIAKEKARPPPLVPEEIETQEEPPLPLRQLSRRRLSPLFPWRRAKLAKRLRHHFHRLRVNLVSLRWIVRPAWQLKLRPAG